METERSTPESEGPRPYDPPTIVWEEVFEPYAFKVCGQKPGGPPMCAGARAFT